MGGGGGTVESPGRGWGWLDYLSRKNYIYFTQRGGAAHGMIK